jgi:hypothetical protein
MGTLPLILPLGKVLFRVKILFARREETDKQGISTEGYHELHAVVMQYQGARRVSSKIRMSPGKTES